MRTCCTPIESSRAASSRWKTPLHAECDWLDLVAPDEAERALVDVRFGEVLPTADDMEELEASSRYFTDEDGIHVHSLFMFRADGRPRNGTVAFTLTQARLLSSRDNELPDFRLMRLQVRNARVLAESPLQVLSRCWRRRWITSRTSLKSSMPP